MEINSYNKEPFIQKNGIVVSFLAKKILTHKVGDKLETVKDISEDLSVGRGTVQAALSFLKSHGAIDTVSKGHMGTELTEINYEKLFALSGISEIRGVMPMRRSSKLTALAQVVQEEISRAEGVNTDISYVHGAKNRLELLLSGEYGFAVMSRQSAESFLDNPDVKIVKVIDGLSYVDHHILISRADFNDDGKKTVRIGVDFSSRDQVIMSVKYFQNREIVIVPCENSNIISALKEKKIDCAIDIQINDYSKYSFCKTTVVNDPDNSKSYTETAIVIQAQNKMMRNFIECFLDVKRIKQRMEELCSDANHR